MDQIERHVSGLGKFSPPHIFCLVCSMLRDVMGIGNSEGRWKLVLAPWGSRIGRWKLVLAPWGSRIGRMETKARLILSLDGVCGLRVASVFFCR